MKIAYNPTGQSALTASSVDIKSNDIIFDLPGQAIWAKEQRFGGMVTNALDGMVPKYDNNDGTINNATNDWVLTVKNGSLGWYKLPANAFNNTTYTLSGALSGNTFVSTLTPSSGSVTTATVPAMVGATSSAAGKAGLVIAPAAGDQGKFFMGDGTWKALSVSDTGTGNAVTDVTVSGNTITLTRGTNFSVNGHTHNTGNITALTSYSKATAAAALATTDSLNTALGKLEYKLDVAYNLVTAANDSDGTIENLKEILDVLSGIKDTETIQSIIGKYLPLTGGTLTGALTTQNITPSSNNTYSLGTSSVKWANVYATTFNGNATSASTASKLGTADKGSATKPIYLNAGAPTECTTYAGGTAVTLNGTSKSGSTASFYAPEGVGSTGQILKSNGSGAPVWSTIASIMQNLTIKIKSGTTEGTDLYTYDGSTAKSIDIKQGSNITLTAVAGALTIAAVDTKVTNAASNNKAFLLGHATQGTNATTLSNSAVYMENGVLNSTAIKTEEVYNDSGYLYTEEYIEGTQTSVTSSWTGISKDKGVYNGKRIVYWLPYAGSGQATLTLTFSDNSTNTSNCYYGGSTRLTTHYSANNAIRFVYRENVKINNTTLSGWWADADYIDGNTYTSAYCATGAATAAKTATCTGYTISGEHYIHVTIANTNTIAQALTLNINGKGAKAIYINGTISGPSNYNLKSGTYLVYYDGDNYHFRSDGYLPIKETFISRGDTISMALDTTWKDTGISFNTSNSYDGEGSYVIQISSDTGLWTGYFALRTKTGTSSNNTIIADEIVLQGGDATTYQRPYLRTLTDHINNKIKLQIAHSEDIAEKTWVIKFKRVL